MKYFWSDLHINHKKILDFQLNRIEQFNLDRDLVAEVELSKQFWLHEENPEAKIARKEEYDDINGELIKTHNQAIVDRINSTIKKSDDLYIIGDAVFGSSTDGKKWLSKIRGNKTLVWGNHDKSYKIMFEMGFHKVVENDFVKLTNGVESRRVLMSHFPYYPTILDRMFKRGTDVRYMHKRIVDNGDWLLHGHTHSKERVKGKQIHVGVDAWDKPVSEKELLDTILKM